MGWGLWWAADDQYVQRKWLKTLAKPSKKSPPPPPPWPHTLSLATRQPQCTTHIPISGNSIAFGSAPLREADSQPISQLDRPAVSQTETHFGFFISGRHGSKQWGELMVSGLAVAEW